MDQGFFREFFANVQQLCKTDNEVNRRSDFETIIYDDDCRPSDVDQRVTRRGARLRESRRDDDDRILAGRLDCNEVTPQ